jgi:hypothetical protein
MCGQISAFVCNRSLFLLALPQTKYSHWRQLQVSQAEMNNFDTTFFEDGSKRVFAWTCGGYFYG